jgi:leader peptidase (prepilin peptidase) / N-methyltransferase
METLLFAAPATLAATLAAALFGLLIGSFLNVVVYRLPVMAQRELDNYIAHEAGKDLPHPDRFNLMVPRSACPHCGHQITALENIPIVSWLVLRGKCSACKAPISPRYPIVEAVTGLLSAVLVWHFGSGWLGLAGLAFAYFLIAMTLIDYDTKTLPDDLTYPLLWLGLLVNLNGTIVPLRDAVIGAMAGYLALWAVYWLFKLATGKEGMGFGDFKLLAALGAWLGWQMILPIVLGASAIGAVVGLIMKMNAGLREGRYVPFGPFLAGGGLVVLFAGQQTVLGWLGWA